MRAPSFQEDVLEEDVEVKMAFKILAQDSDLHARILHDLLGRPKRYFELKHLLGDKAENSLTVALKTMRRGGLLDQRTDARSRPPIHRYEITPLGIEVLLTAEMLAVMSAQVQRLREALAGGEIALDLVANAAALAPALGALPAAGAAASPAAGGGRKPVDTYVVRPQPGGGWRVERRGAKRPSDVVETKREAVKRARELAMKRKGTHVVVHKADGSFQREIAVA